MRALARSSLGAGTQNLRVFSLAGRTPPNSFPRAREPSFSVKSEKLRPLAGYFLAVSPPECGPDGAQFPAPSSSSFLLAHTKRLGHSGIFRAGCRVAAGAIL